MGQGGGAAVSFRDLTVGRLLTQLAEALPENEALVYSQSNLRWTFRELEAEARLIARGLVGRNAMRTTSVPARSVESGDAGTPAVMS